MRSRAGTQSSQVNPQQEGEENLSEKPAGLSENPSQTPVWVEPVLREKLGLTEEQSQTSERTRVQSLCGV